MENHRPELPETTSDEVFVRRAKGLEWLLFDVDGVLTTGHLHYTRRGEEVKTFHVRDGLGFRLAQRAGLKLGLLSGRRSRPLERRAADLDFDATILGSGNKPEDFELFLRAHHTTPGRVAYIGDDLPDLSVLGRCALSFAPADAVPEVRAVVHKILACRGGEGAGREMIELVLKARGDWEQAMTFFSLDPDQPIGSV